ARTHVTRPARIEPRADEALRRMSAALSGAASFSFRAATTMDEPVATGRLAEFSRQTTIVVRRPDRLFAEVNRGSETWFVWYLDREMTILDKSNNTWALARV